MFAVVDFARRIPVHDAMAFDKAIAPSPVNPRPTPSYQSPENDVMVTDMDAVDVVASPWTRFRRGAGVDGSSSWCGWVSRAGSAGSSSQDGERP